MQIAKVPLDRWKIGLELIIKKDRHGLRTNNVHVPQIYNAIPQTINVYAEREKASNIFPIRTTKQTNVVLSSNELKSGKAIPN